jgi:hypothetical protein
MRALLTCKTTRWTRHLIAGACALAPLLAAGADPQTFTGTVAPGGYLGAINTPVATVLPFGSFAAAYSNSIPDIANPLPGIGHFGVVTGGVGLLPGLEAFARLSFSGDVWCNMYEGCPAGERDLSISAKYQLPWVFPGNTRLAGGFTDFGGAATNYRSAYVVATSDLGPLDVSLGYAKRYTPKALLNGVFANSVLRLTDRLSAQLEADTQELRAGLAYVYPLSGDADLTLGYSRKLTDHSGQQSGQLSAALVLHLDRARNATLKQYPPPLVATPTVGPTVQAEPAVPAVPVIPVVTASSASATAAQTAPASAPGQSSLSALAQAFAQAGFQHVRVAAITGDNGAPMLAVQLEPVAWRHSRLVAVGQALKTWLSYAASPSANAPGALPSNELALTLTQRGQAVLQLRTNVACATAFRNGSDQCAQGQAIQLLPVNAALAPRPDTPVTNSQWFRPQLEIGLNLRMTVGTEYGLFDYSSALEVGAEIPLAQGWAVQGTASTPIFNTGSFDEGRIFGDQRHKKTQMEQAFVSYWSPAGPLAAQVSLGFLNPIERGGQLDAVWLSDDGRWRAHAMSGLYSKIDTPATPAQQSVIGALRYSLIPGRWQMDLTAGQFHNQDRGWRVTSAHLFGDAMFKLFYRQSGRDDTGTMPKTSFAGFEVSVPLGPQQALELGPLTVRGRDRWRTGLETKVGATDNYLTPGYGFVPQVRHGLTTDVTDYDRAGLADLWADRDRMRIQMR